MIRLAMFDTEKELQELTGLDHDGLWDAGFNLDDWDVGFMSEEPLTIPHKEYDSDWGEEEYEEDAPGAHWLVMQMNCYCVGCCHVEYGGRHYYTVHHA